jgi:hypothetical protein
MDRILIGEAVKTNYNVVGIFAGQDYDDNNYCYIHAEDTVRKVLMQNISRKLNNSCANISFDSDTIKEYNNDGSRMEVLLDAIKTYAHGHMKLLTIKSNGRQTVIYKDQNGNINISRIDQM